MPMAYFRQQVVSLKVKLGSICLRGAKVSYEVPELPKNGPYAVDFLFASLAGNGIENAKIQLYEPDKKKLFGRVKQI